MLEIGSWGVCCSLWANLFGGQYTDSERAGKPPLDPTFLEDNMWILHEQVSHLLSRPLQRTASKFWKSKKAISRVDLSRGQHLSYGRAIKPYPELTFPEYSIQVLEEQDLKSHSSRRRSEYPTSSVVICIKITMQLVYFCLFIDIFLT